MSRKFGAFDPASTATTTTIVDAAIDGVVFYAPFDTDVNDDSSTGHGVTAQGNAAVSSAQSVFGGASLALDGNGDYLQIGTSSTFNWGTADFTIEAFINHTGIDNSFAQIFDFRNSSGVGFTMNINNSGQLGFYSSLLGGYIISNSSATAIGTNSFKHVAVVRTSGTVKMFIEGVQKASASHTNNYTVDAPLKIGIKYNDDNAHAFKGFIDDLRISKNLAVYATAFSVPTTAVGATEPTSVADTRSHSHVWNYSDIYKARRADSWPNLTYDTQIALYLPFNGSLTDFSSYGHTVSAVGDAAVTTSPFQLHASCAFDGNGDLLTVPHNNIFDFVGNDFTIEGFINPTTAAGVQGVYAQWGGTGSRSFKVVISTNAKLEINGSKDGSSGGQINQIASTALELNTFSHFAVTREGSNYRIFINGVNRGTTTESGALYNSSANIAIGGNRADQTTNTLFGNLEDFRVINGLALYTTAFEVPTRSINNTLTVNP